MQQNPSQSDIAEFAPTYASMGLDDLLKRQKDAVGKIRSVTEAYKANGSTFENLTAVDGSNADDKRTAFRKQQAEAIAIRNRIQEIRHMETAHTDAEAIENAAHTREIEEGAPVTGENRRSATQYRTYQEVFADAEAALVRRINEAAGLSADSNFFKAVISQRGVTINGPLGLLLDPVNVAQTSASPAGFEVYPPMSDVVVAGRRPPLMVMDITPRIGVMSNAFKYRKQVPLASANPDSIEQLREASGDNAATTAGKRGWKAEGATSTAEANYRWTTQTANIETIFGFTQATLEQLADEPQAQALILSQLRMDLRRNMELALLHGDGANETPLGLFSSGAGTVDFPAPASGTTEYGFDKIAEGIYDQVYDKTFLNVDALIFNAIDWRKLITTRDDRGNLQFMDPQDVSAMRVLGVPVMLSQFAKEDRTAGTVLMGNFMEGGRLLDRQELMVAQTDADGTTFRSGNTTFRAHARCGVARFYDAAFCTVTNFDGKKKTA